MNSREAFEQGAARGGALVANRAVHANGARPLPQGLLIAEGDSWFDYPGGDILSALEDLGFEVEGDAHWGDTLEDMSFNPRQLGDFYRTISKVKARGVVPRALLLSGGGNDLAGDEFAMILDHASSGLPTINPTVLAGLIDVRLRVSLAHWIGSVDAVAQRVFRQPIRIVLHGYDYPVPDGRGFTIGPMRVKGPWLRPAFWLKGHSNLQRNRSFMRDLIDRLNEMQISLMAELNLPNLVHADLRNTLSSVLYENDWDNELHPTEAGFRALARKIAARA